MTRRRVIFLNPDGKELFMTPEFNGDKSEFKARGVARDACDKDWAEILHCFRGVTSLSQFEQASKEAQAAYHSFLGDEVLPIERLNDDVELCDEKVYLSDEAMISYFHLLYQIDWVKSRGYDINDYYEGRGFNGESWVCYNEFCDTELQDEEYMRYLLNDNDFSLWRTYQERN